MLFAVTWKVLVGSHTGAFGRLMDIWEIGQRVVDVIGRTAPQCLVSELVSTVVGTRQTSEDAAGRPNRRPASLRPSAEFVNQAIVGGIGKELLDPAYNHIREYAHGRPTVLDEDAIRRRGLAGVAAGRRALIDALNENASELEALRDVLTDQLGQSEIDDIPIHGDHSQTRPGADGGTD